jgi:hypothetical protein
MRGYLGKETLSEADEDEDDNDAYLQDTTGQSTRYDLVYVLDAVYHFTPAVPYFAASVLPVLTPGTGVLAYTDILPPPDLSAVLGHLVLPPLVGVPAKNLVSRPKSLEEYRALLERIGYVDVVIEDWSSDVWAGFAKNLSDRGMMWSVVGRVARWADAAGWKFVAVRGRRPDI